MADENEVPSGGDEQTFGEKAKEVVGWATGDREVEAAGSPDDQADIRVEHGDKGIVEPSP